MDVPVLADQQALIYISSVRMQDAVLKTCCERWIIGTNGERELRKSVLSAWHDDDDDFDLAYYDVKIEPVSHYASLCPEKRSRECEVHLHWHYSQAHPGRNGVSTSQIDRLENYLNSIGLCEKNLKKQQLKNVNRDVQWTRFPNFMA